MKASMRKLFSFSVTDTEYFEVEKDKIELLGCSCKDMTCRKQLLLVNKCYVESEHYYREKDFKRSIDILKSAFYSTLELTEIPCSKCAMVFRSTITESLENIHSELKKMSTGLFGYKRFQSSYLMADHVLKELKDVGLSATIKIRESNERFPVSNHERKVG